MFSRRGETDQPRSSSTACAAASLDCDRLRISTPRNCATCDLAMPLWIPARQAESLASITLTSGGVPSTSASAPGAQQRLGAPDGLHHELRNINRSEGHRLIFSPAKMISEIDLLGRAVNTPRGRNSFKISSRFIFSAGNSQRIPIRFGFENCARFPAGVPFRLLASKLLVGQKIPAMQAACATAKFPPALPSPRAATPANGVRLRHKNSRV